jgi:stress response protein YsnF
MDYSKPTPVIGKDGARGTLVDAVAAGTDTTHALVQFETGQRVLVPLDALTLQADGSYYYLALSQNELVDGRSVGTQHPDDPLVLPVIEEQVVVQRNTRITGRVRISKTVHEREELVDEPLLRRTVQVEHVPINRVVDSEIPVRYEGDTMIIPVLEEVLVVEKRLMLKEELHITQRQDEIRQPQRIVLRTEDITVERIVPNGQPVAERAEQA